MQTIKTVFFTIMVLILSVTFGWTNPISSVEKSNTTEIEEALNKDNLERELGRKLNFTERIVLKRAKKKLKKLEKQEPGEPASGKARAALILGAMSLPMLLIPYIGLLGTVTSIIAILLGIFAQDRSGSKTDKFAKIGMWLGIASALAILLAILLFPSNVSGWLEG